MSIGKFRIAESADYLLYKLQRVYNYNYMTVEPNKPRSSEQDHVVVVDDVDLIYQNF